jgi:Zn ribbon nucleic-acid-binding protein
MRLKKKIDYKITAICPRCKKKHKIYLEWRGRGTPRVYCKGCKQFVEDSSASMRRFT